MLWSTDRNSKNLYNVICFITWRQKILFETAFGQIWKDIQYIPGFSLNDCTTEKTFHSKFTANYFWDKCNSHGLKVEESMKDDFIFTHSFIHSLSQKYYWTPLHTRYCTSCWGYNGKTITLSVLCSLQSSPALSNTVATSHIWLLSIWTKAGSNWAML